MDLVVAFGFVTMLFACACMIYLLLVALKEMIH